MIRFEHFLVRWNGIITALVTLCAVTAIVFGIVWMFLRKRYLALYRLGSEFVLPDWEKLLGV